MIQSHPRREVGLKDLFAGRQRLERDADIVVAGGLIAGEGARITPNIGQMRRQSGYKTQ